MRRLASTIAWLAMALTLSAAPLRLASNGEAKAVIAIDEKANAEVIALAAELAKGLHRITGATFQIQRGATEGGLICFGTSAEWPGEMPDAADRSESLQRDDYLLRSRGDRLYLLGRTPHGLQNALWGFFHELGFRQFFPGPTWELWPEERELSIEIDRYEVPAYATRRIGMNVWPENRAAWEQWQVRNRMKSGFQLQTNHIYEEIIRRHPEHFARYPEDIATGEKGERHKLDPSRSTTLEVAAAYALDYFRRHPNADTVSMDPSDGSGWRVDSPLGSPSNQAVTLANHVARIIREAYPGRKVGIYAYHEHSPPPTIEVEKNLVVSIATAFLREGHTTLGLMKAWHAKGAEIGIREYSGVWPWCHDLPGRSRAADLSYLFRTIPKYHAHGARYWISEATAGWGVHGPGHYITARLLWDVKEAERREVILDDFYTRSFGPAAEAMKGYYSYLFAESRPLLSEDLLARMYRGLNTALTAAGSDRAIRARIFDLLRYTLFVEKMFAYQNAQGKARQEAYDALCRWVYQTRKTQMIDGRGPFSDLLIRDKTIQGPGWFAKEGEHPQKVPGEISEEELLEQLKVGIERWKPNDFENIAFTGPLQPLALEQLQPGKEFQPLHLRGANRLHLYAEPGQAAFKFTVRGGFIRQTQGPVRLALYAEAHPFPNEPIATAEVPPDQEEHVIRLETRYEGAHHLEINDGGSLTHLHWPKGQRVALPAAPDDYATLYRPADLFFYVPKGTSIIGGYSAIPRGRIRNPEGKVVYDFQRLSGPGYFSLRVPKGADGAVWMMEQVRGERYLLTVPPFFARSPNELLLPESALSDLSRNDTP